jgi:hypothetical protein
MITTIHAFALIALVMGSPLPQVGWMDLPNPVYVVLVNILIRRNDEHVLGEGGGDQEAVERVAVEEGQGFDVPHMFQRHTDDPNVILPDRFEKAGNAPANSSLPTLTLMAISQAEAMLTYKADDRSSKMAMASLDNWLLSWKIQIAACVSRR